MQALQDAERARTIYEELNSVRGLALCALAEGLVRTQLALLNGFDTLAGEQQYEGAIQAFERARSTFDDQLSREVQRRIEVRIGLGGLYRERGITLHQRGEECSLRPARFLPKLCITALLLRLNH